MTTIGQDMKWVTDNYEFLQEAYPGLFIVAKDQIVIAVGRTYKQAYEQTLKMLGSEIEFVVHRIETGDLFAYDIRISP